MNPVLFFSLPIFFLLGWTALSAWRASRRGASEEKAHASAWRRRARTKAAKGAKGEASIMILGDSDSRVSCRVKRVSRSSLQAISTRAPGEGSQVRVEWGDDVFVGNVFAQREEPPGFRIEVALLSSTYSGGLFVDWTREVEL